MLFRSWFNYARTNPTDLTIQIARVECGSSNKVIEAGQDFSAVNARPNQLIACASKPPNYRMVGKPDSPTVKRISSGQSGQQRLSKTRHGIPFAATIAKQAGVSPFRRFEVNAAVLARKPRARGRKQELRTLQRLSRRRG